MNAYTSILEQQSTGVVKVKDATKGIEALRCHLFNVIVLEVNRENFASQIVFIKEAANYISMNKVVVIIEKVKDGPKCWMQDCLSEIGIQDIYVKPVGLIVFEELMKRFDLVLQG